MRRCSISLFHTTPCTTWQVESRSIIMYSQLLVISYVILWQIFHTNFGNIYIWNILIIISKLSFYYVNRNTWTCKGGKYFWSSGARTRFKFQFRGKPIRKYLHLGNYVFAEILNTYGTAYLAFRIFGKLNIRRKFTEIGNFKNPNIRIYIIYAWTYFVGWPDSNYLLTETPRPVAVAHLSQMADIM